VNQKIEIIPPATELELTDCASLLCGKTIASIADQLGLLVPSDQMHNKGWVGNLAELFLGATASTQSEPDFQKIAVELKTVPMSKPGLPKESTYVCTVNLTESINSSWKDSAVYRKLRRVLWLPVESDQSIPLRDRRFGNAILWSPDNHQEDTLKKDWEEIMELVTLGELDKLSASLGTYLQVRPKAANANSLGRSYDEDGRPTTTLPRGFYLRTSFTRTLFQ
jgi:DNA mismatch repair protein MutH